VEDGKGLKYCAVCSVETCGCVMGLKCCAVCSVETCDCVMGLKCCAVCKVETCGCVMQLYLSVCLCVVIQLSSCCEVSDRGKMTDIEMGRACSRYEGE
jgi:hypothetical protein